MLKGTMEEANRGAETSDSWVGHASGCLEKLLWEGDIWAEIKYEKLFDRRKHIQFRENIMSKSGNTGLFKESKPSNSSAGWWGRGRVVGDKTGQTGNIPVVGCTRLTITETIRMSDKSQNAFTVIYRDDVKLTVREINLSCRNSGSL